MDWLHHALSIGRALGFNIELVSPGQVAALHPFNNLEGVIGALHTPDDGHVDPSGVTQALAAGARARGVKIIRRCRATNVQQNLVDEWVVKTDRGTITCEHLVNAGGTYARHIGGEVRAATADDLDDAPLFCDRTRARVSEPRL